MDGLTLWALFPKNFLSVVKQFVLVNYVVEKLLRIFGFKKACGYRG